MKNNSNNSPYTSSEEVYALLAQTRAEVESPTVKRIIPKRKKKVRTPAQNVLHWILNGIYLLIVALLVTVIAVNASAKREGRLPSLFGYSVFMVETGSMVPTLPIGCYIVSRAPDDPAAIPSGTIITFYNTSGTIITHRIIEVLYDDGGNTSYRTKGDNPANSPDLEAVTPERVIGTWQFTFTLPQIW